MVKPQVRNTTLNLKGLGLRRRLGHHTNDLSANINPVKILALFVYQERPTCRARGNFQNSVDRKNIAPMFKKQGLTTPRIGFLWTAP